jgi:hypothetical protein
MAGDSVQLSGYPTQGGSGGVNLTPAYVFTPGAYVVRLLGPANHNVDSPQITLTSGTPPSVPTVTTDKSSYQIGIDKQVSWATQGWTENFTIYVQGEIMRVSDGASVMMGDQVQLTGYPTAGGSGNVPLDPGWIFTSGTYFVRLLGPGGHNVDSPQFSIVGSAPPPPTKVTVTMDSLPDGASFSFAGLGFFSSGQSASIVPGDYPIAVVMQGATFSSWTVSGGLTVDNAASSSTVVHVTADGVLTANFQGQGQITITIHVEDANSKAALAGANVTIGP